jgi:hypothetical protein
MRIEGLTILHIGVRLRYMDNLNKDEIPWAHAPLDLSIDCTGDDTGDTWWECPICGDYAWLAPGQEPPECSCEGDPDTLPAAGRSADAWWAWHDADPSRWSPGEDPLEATADAERRCTAWLRGESTDGPDTISRTAPGEHYSYLPIDVGFDPRVCGISVELRERS